MTTEWAIPGLLYIIYRNRYFSGSWLLAKVLKGLSLNKMRYYFSSLKKNWNWTIDICTYFHHKFFQKSPNWRKVDTQADEQNLLHVFSFYNERVHLPVEWDSSYLKYSKTRLKRQRRDWIFCIVINECCSNGGL